MDGNGIKGEGATNIVQLSDYSFLERSVHEVYIWIWFILHVWRCDRFAALSWRRIMSFELKSFVTIFILFALPLESFYDIVSTRIKYIEGFYTIPGMDDVIRSKPRWLWSEENQIWFMPSYYILMAGISFQTITLFLLQCFWNYLINSIAKCSFMSRGEFSLYIVWGIICVGIFPVLPYVFKDRGVLLEAIPQLVYAAQLVILTLLGIRTHLKFIRLIKITSSYKNSESTIAKIRYFIDMNKLLTAALAIMAAAFLLLSIDILTSAKIINNSKLASDLLVAHVNFAAVIEWLAVILIFYPRKGFVGTGAGGSSFNTNINSNFNSISASQISHMINSKYSNIPPGSVAGAGINNVNPSSQTNSGNNFNNNFSNTGENRLQFLQPKPSIGEFSNNSENRHQLLQSKPSIGDIENKHYNNRPVISNVQPNVDKSNLNNNNIINNGKENSRTSILQKQTRFKKKTSSPSDSTLDLGKNSDNEGKPVNYLKRNISISKDGKMLYGETKPLGKVKGAEFVAVEKADPSFIPSYYFMNELKDRDGNIVHRIPSIIKNLRDDNPEVGNSNVGGGDVNKQGIQQDIVKSVVQEGTIGSQQGTLQENNVDNSDHQDHQGSGDDDDDDEYFYAM